MDALGPERSCTEGVLRLVLTQLGYLRFNPRSFQCGEVRKKAVIWANIAIVSRLLGYVTKRLEGTRVACFQQLPARTLSHIAAALLMLPCLSAASCCCAKGAVVCRKASTTHCLDRCLSSCSQMAWSCRFNSCASQYLISGQGSTEFGCNRPYCCGNGAHTCNRMQPGRACKCRKKPPAPSGQMLSGISRGQAYAPTSPVLKATGWTSSLTSTPARYSLLCRFLL